MQIYKIVVKGFGIVSVMTLFHLLIFILFIQHDKHSSDRCKIPFSFYFNFNMKKSGQNMTFLNL